MGKPIPGFVCIEADTYKETDGSTSLALLFKFGRSDDQHISDILGAGFIAVERQDEKIYFNRANEHTGGSRYDKLTRAITVANPLSVMDMSDTAGKCFELQQNAGEYFIDLSKPVAKPAENAAGFSAFVIKPVIEVRLTNNELAYLADRAFNSGIREWGKADFDSDDYKPHQTKGQYLSMGGIIDLLDVPNQTHYKLNRYMLIEGVRKYLENTCHIRVDDNRLDIDDLNSDDLDVIIQFAIDRPDGSEEDE